MTGEIGFHDFPEGVRRDETYPATVADQTEFMQYMGAYLGTSQNVIDHFMRVRLADVPGMVYLHDRAATRLEAVAQALNGEMPASTIGLQLRGRYRLHEQNSKSRMAHPLGYATDYRVYQNPMLTDPDIVTLLNVATGGAINFQMGMSIEQRHQLLEAIGRGEADEAQERAFFERFAAEYVRVATASAGFKHSLSEGAIEELRALRDASLAGADVGVRLQEVIAPWYAGDALEARLNTDVEFVLGGAEERQVRNPSILQIMELGFFTPDADPQDGEAFDPDKHGFNLKFMMLMAKNGFEQGILWSENTLDGMHFELVEAVQALPDPDEVAARLTHMKAQLFGNVNQKRHRE